LSLPHMLSLSIFSMLLRLTKPTLLCIICLVIELQKPVRPATKEVPAGASFIYLDTL
jgi:hypothetical protein